MTMANGDIRVIQCNFSRPTKVALKGARAYVHLTNPGNGHERISVLVFSRGKRWVLKWEDIGNLVNFRAKTLPPEHPRHPDGILDFGRPSWPYQRLYPADEAVVASLNAAVARRVFETHAAESVALANGHRAGVADV